ncbi:MAG: hypothetical protein WBJ19_10315 [Rhodoferax sp.]
MRNFQNPSVTTSFTQTLSLLKGLPFDMAREQYAKAVQVGLIERSMLGWARFERHVDLLEKMTLGPWARRV